MLLTALEFVGLVAFAASGALAAVRARLDVFGVVVVGLTTALGGGVIRDVLDHNRVRAEAFIRDVSVLGRAARSTSLRLVC